MADSSTENNEVDMPSSSFENKDADEDFEMECSDEEMRPRNGKEWEPNFEEIVALLKRIEKDKFLELEWTTLGRRPPTPAAKFDSFKDVDKSAIRKCEEKSDFDFQDEMANLKISSKAIRPVGADSGPRGSAKKKTTSLDAILSNMARHRKLDMMEDDDDEDPLP